MLCKLGKLHPALQSYQKTYRNGIWLFRHAKTHLNSYPASTRSQYTFHRALALCANLALTPPKIHLHDKLQFRPELHDGSLFHTR